MARLRCEVEACRCANPPRAAQGLEGMGHQQQFAGGVDVACAAPLLAYQVQPISTRLMAGTMSW